MLLNLKAIATSNELGFLRGDLDSCEFKVVLVDEVAKTLVFSCEFADFSASLAITLLLLARLAINSKDFIFNRLKFSFICFNDIAPSKLIN